MLINDENGKPLYLQGVYFDITKQKESESQREALIQELETKNSELERFTYTVSHDLKAPAGYHERLSWLFNRRCEKREFDPHGK